MGRRRIARAGTGLAVGALLTAPLLGVLALGALVGIPMVPDTVFEWLVRVLPGRVVTFGLDSTLWVLEGLGLDISRTAKTAQQVLALASLFLVGLLIGLLFFLLARTTDKARIKRYGLSVGAALGLFSVVVTLIQGIPTSLTGQLGFVVWVLALFILWGWGLARLYLVTFPAVDASPTATGAVPVVALEALQREAALATVGEMETRETALEAEARATAPDAEARAISRRRFIIQMGGVAATFIVVGAGVGAVLRSQASPETTGPTRLPSPFPTRRRMCSRSPEPVRNTRPSLTTSAWISTWPLRVSTKRPGGSSWMAWSRRLCRCGSTRSSRSTRRWTCS